MTLHEKEAAMHNPHYTPTVRLNHSNFYLQKLLTYKNLTGTSLVGFSSAYLVLQPKYLVGGRQGRGLGRGSCLPPRPSVEPRLHTSENKYTYSRVVCFRLEGSFVAWRIKVTLCCLHTGASTDDTA